MIDPRDADRNGPSSRRAGATHFGVGPFIRARRGNVAMIFAVLLPVLILLIGGVLDLSTMVNTKTRLQDATDAAALAASAQAAKNPSASETQLKITARRMLLIDYGSAAIKDFHVCSPTIPDCSDNGAAMAMGTVAISSAAPAPCYLARFLPGVCTAAGQSQPIYVHTTTNIAFAQTLQLNLLLDTSASMIVGATQNDVNAIATWTAAHWSEVKPLGGSDNPPCAFACHDEGGATTGNSRPSDMWQGILNARKAGATTRFDVMVQAAQDLIDHVQNEVTASQLLSKNTYVWNINSFDSAIHSWSPANADAATAEGGLKNSIAPGLDTYLNNSLATYGATLGLNGDGTSVGSPTKFLILVTDGLESDRSNNWSCQSWVSDPIWGWNPTCIGGFAKPLNTANCDTIKNNGVVLAVLETPYVPLTGQSPNVAPYEKTVRHVIYPGGSTAPSTISTALNACASQGYYFQATNSSDIATGFITLADKFINSTAYIKR